jgi:hypothetical protein
MKKKAFLIIGLVLIATVAVLNANLGLRSDGSLSDIALANIEALAKNEGSDSDCSDGVARLCCKIWTVTYNGSGASCTTGGDYKCWYCIE